MAALQDSDPSNPVAVEVARRIDAYATNLQAHVRRPARIPPDILRMNARWPIEAVAMCPTTEAIRKTLSQTPPPEKA